MVFSPQSDKLAIAQTDNMVFVYKVGSEWGDKKSICNKFQQSCSITSIAWPSKRLNEIVYGLADGKVKVGQLKTYKPATLYETDSYVTAICCNPSGDAIVSAHLDGSIYTFNFDSIERGASCIARHSCVPFALTWGGSIVVAGNDGQVKFYDEDGGEEHSFDHSKDPNCREFTSAVCNPTGDSVVLGNFDSLYVYTRNKDSMGWESKSVTRVENMYSVTAMDWKSDGSVLAVGTLCGVVDFYDICVKRSIFKGGFEVTYVSHSQVIVRQVETNMRIVIRSQYGCEILKVNVYKNRYVVGTTTDTLLLGDLETLKISEVQYQATGEEKFIFDNANACIIYYGGEVTIVEYGLNDILGSVRTSHTNSHVLSLRINERPSRVIDRHSGRESFEEDNKKVVYLLDSQTICIKDLVANSSITINHDSKVDWLELNTRANLLLFRDKRRHLHLYNTETQTRTQLLNFCTFVQWVPNSDVVVAQNRSSLCVWYNILAPDQITFHTIKGDVEDIERSEGKTEVIVDEGISQAVYPLDEGLIEFGTACDDRNYEKAIDILDNLEMSTEVEAMWKQLKDMALQIGELAIAKRCAAAIGDVALSKYISEVLEIKKQAEEDMGIRGADHYLVRSKLSLLQKDLKLAEIEMLNQGKVDECIAMYQKYNKHDAAIRVAEQARHPDTVEMRQTYFQHLLDTNQEEQAALLKEREGDYHQAINLYLKGNMPGRAANVIIEANIQQPIQLLDAVATALTRASLFELAGEFYERLDELQRALDNYLRGHAYRKAVELSRRCFPGRVVELQSKWGDYLVSQKQVDMAINHYIEAKEYMKAIEAALNARQYPRALQLVEVMDMDAARPYYKQLARYYEDSGQYESAEKCYLAADQSHLAVEMHTKLGHWEVAHKLAMSYMSEGEVGLLYISQAQKLEAQGRLKEAEKLYLTVKEKDLAINMYKKNRRYDDMIRLVQEFRPDLLKETHQFLAQTMEMEGSLKDAEHHYVEAQEWHSAVNMYRSNELWDDAIRVAKFYGGIAACKRVTIALLMAIGVTEGLKHLSKHGLVEASIDHATENGAFDLAFEVAHAALPKKLPDIYLKHALFLEEDEHFAEAEEEFIKAGKPKEAIDMYVHQRDWKNALRVAESYDAATVSDVYLARAKVCADERDYRQAEEYYLAASHPEIALQMYQDADMWPEALRLAQLHLPHRVVEVNIGYQTAQAKSGKGTSKNDYLNAGKTLENSKQWSQAIDTYLSAKRERMESVDELVDVWERALELARTYIPNRLVEVGLEVSRRYVDMKREEAAADIMFEIGRQDEAINICLNAKKYEKAKALSTGNPSLRRRVDEAYQGHLVTNENTTELVGLGQADVALDVLAKRGNWEKVWEVAAKEKLSTSTIAKYVMIRVEELLRGDIAAVDEAVRTLHKRQGPVTEAALVTYKKLVRSVLSRGISAEGPGHANILSMLREVLYRLANQFKASSSDRSVIADIDELLMATHYSHIMVTCKALGMKDIAAKCAVTLMKYPFIVPQDKAFYLAGSMCKEVGNTNLAFMLLNRYVDVTEAIDSNDTSFLDNSEYTIIDGIPLNGPLPSSHYLDSEVGSFAVARFEITQLTCDLTIQDLREEVRTWVLSVVTDSTIDQRFPRREQTRNTLYEALFSSDRPTCIVTGYPIHPADLLEVSNSSANRKDWNAYVAKVKTDPWSGQPQNPIY
jgi:intraflagellar transport protein 172